MNRILFLLFIFFQAAPSLAMDPFTPPPAAIESTPKSKEIKKIAKLLEDPQEREKLLKTLKVLAAAQEAEEKKERGTLGHYIMPLVQFGMDALGDLFAGFKKIPGIFHEVIEFFKIDKNRADLWVALKMLPLLLVIGGLLEGSLTWFFRRRLRNQESTMDARRLGTQKGTYAYLSLFYAFLYSLLFLPILVSSPSVENWIIGFWLTLFAIRIFLLERKLRHQATDAPSAEVSSGSLLPVIVSRGGIFLHLFGGVVLWGLLISGLAFVLGTNSYGKDFILNLVLLMSFPVFILYFRAWRTRKMPGYLAGSRTLATAPHRFASLVNPIIQYLPWFLLASSIPLLIDRAFFSGTVSGNYTIKVLETLAVLALFLAGRHHIDAIARYKTPKSQMAKVQAFTSYAASLRFPLARGIQWVWHVAFLGSLMEIWSAFFSGMFMDVLSHPLTGTFLMIGMIWGVLYLLWLGIDFLVQFHTKPQVVRGKKREPTAFAKTFGPMLHSVARWVVVFIAIFTTLESLGFDLKVLVYLMSAFAFAISLGSQSLVKDVINGFFALVDGSFSVGDHVTVGAHTGMVESLSLRAITLRHKDGALQTIPFSEVGNIINRSRDYMVVSVDAAVSHKAKISSVYKALSQTAEEMSEDPVFGKMILVPLSISGIDQFSDRAVHVSASITITPDPKRAFEREFNRRLKIHMDALKIAPPVVFQETWE